MGGDFNFGGGGGAGIQFDESVLLKIADKIGSEERMWRKSGNAQKNVNGYDDNDSCDQNLTESESESESRERWISIGGGGGCGSCDQNNDGGSIKSDEIVEHDDADDQYSPEVITRNDESYNNSKNNSDNNNNIRSKGKSSDKDVICSQSKEHIICGETEDEDSLTKLMNQTTISNKIKSFFSVLSTSCDILEVIGGGGGGGGTAECSLPYRVGYGFSFQINSSVIEDSLSSSSFSSSPTASIPLLSRSDPIVHNYLQNKKQADISSIIDISDEYTSSIKKLRNDNMATEFDSNNDPYDQYEYDIAGGLLHSASVLCGGYMDWCCVTGHASKRIKACLNADVLGSDEVRVEVAKSNKQKMKETSLVRKFGVLKMMVEKEEEEKLEEEKEQEEEEEEEEEKEKEKDDNIIKSSQQENLENEVDKNGINNGNDDSLFSHSSSCSAIIAAKSRVLWLLSVESSSSCRNSIYLSGNNDNEDENKNETETSDNSNASSEYVSYGWSQEGEKIMWFHDRNITNQGENRYEKMNFSCADRNLESGENGSIHNRLLSCFNNKHNFNSNNRTDHNYYNNNDNNNKNDDNNNNNNNNNDNDKKNNNDKNKMDIISVNNFNNSVLDYYISNSLKWTTYSQELFAPLLYCTNNAYVNGDLIFKTDDLKNSQNGHKDENFADLKICNLNIRNHTYENNSYQISNQFNLSDSENSIIKNLNLNDSIMQESLIMKYNSKNSSTSILFYFLFFYFVLNIYLFFIKKLF